MNSKNDGAPLTSGEVAQMQDSKMALDLHRRFLQEVLAEVMPILSAGERSPERLVRALEAYWEACFARREQRKKVVTLALEAQMSALVEPLGRPFFHMIQSELWAMDAASRSTLAASVYNEARAVSVSEADGDERMPELRQKIARMIMQEGPAAK